MNATFDLAVYCVTLLYAGVIAVNIVFMALELPFPKWTIPYKVLGIMFLGLAAKLMFTGMPMELVLQSLGIGLGVLLVCFLLFVKGMLGGGVAKAFPMVMAFLGPAWFWDTLYWVGIILASGFVVGVVLRFAIGMSRALERDRSRPQKPVRKISR